MAAASPDPHEWRVADARFETSAPTLDDAPHPDRPEFAVAGRSNAGKSSLLNAIAGRQGLARTSAAPGRTQLLNFFALALVGRGARLEVRCADLPGELLEVLVVPRGIGALEQGRYGPFPEPPDTEAVAVRGVGPEPGVQALVDEGVGRPEQQILDEDRITVVRHPPAHSYLASIGPRRLFQ